MAPATKYRALKGKAADSTRQLDDSTSAVMIALAMVADAIGDDKACRPGRAHTPKRRHGGDEEQQGGKNQVMPVSQRT